MQTVNDGFPSNKGAIDPCLKEFYSIYNDLSVGDGLVLYGAHIVVPAATVETYSIICMLSTKELNA